MRKSFFTFMLTIVSSVWMTSKAMCQVDACTCLFDDPPVAISGILQLVPLPCPESTEDIPCPPCLTIALNANEQLYYLNVWNDNLNALLDTLVYPVNATVTGHVYTAVEGGLAIRVQDISLHASLPSLCDEWNVLEHLTALGPDYESFGTLHFRLTSDTMINATHYVRLEQDGTYKGALREGTNADIYYVPNNSTHEYLLYAFNAQVGDSLENLWFGANESNRYIINSATVINIESTTPRKFTIDFEWQSVYSYAAINDTSEIRYAELVWLEGLGFQYGGPLNYECPFDCAGGPGLLTLCAYKNGKQVYADPYWSEKVGCEYNRHTLYYLCDEWNVLHEPFSWPGGYNTFKYYLSTDTIINGKQYVKLASDKDYPYCGAFREDINANIYYIPSGSTHEYLLYAFNAQVGDTLSNLWVGGFGEDHQGVVQAVSKGSPRIFTIGVMFYENSEYDYPIQWIEGVGSPETPMGLAVVPTVPADIGVFNLLCAYKNGQQVYATQLSEQFGCFYEGHNPPLTTDTIPLFVQDDPGSSTIDPVDPNQVVATLQGDQLTIHESTGVDVTYSLNHTAPAQAPSHNRAPQSDTFRDEVTIQITESGEYLLQLTNPSWGYTIFGQFYYAPQGIVEVPSSLQGEDRGRLILQNGQLLILRGEKVYTLQGQEVR